MTKPKDGPLRCGLGLSVSLCGKRSVRTLALAALLSASNLTPSRVFAQDAQPKSTDRLSGTVVNSVTHEPIGHALVLSPDERFATMTDNDGRFEFTFPQAEAGQGSAGSTLIGSGVSAGSNGNTRPYALTARKPGFLTDTGNPQQTLGMQSGQDITIPLVPEAIIVGHVALPTSEPPDNIQIELYRREVRNGRARWIQAGTETTRSNGDFRFTELPAGSYKVLTRESLDRDPQASAPGGQMYGYAPVYFPNAKDFGSAATIQLTAGKIVHVDLSLVREPYYRIKVPVANAPPGASFGVNVTVQGRGGPGYALAYNSREQVITGLLPGGSYRLEVGSYGPVSVSGALDFTVNGPLEGPVLTMVPNSPISVHVKEEFTSSEGEGPGRGRGGHGNFNRRGTTNVGLEPVDDFSRWRNPSQRPPFDSEDDSIVLENVQPGRYWVQVYAARGYTSAVTSGNVDLLREPLVVPWGSSVAPIELTLRDDSARLEGTIEGAKTSSGQYIAATEGPAQMAVPGTPANAHVYCIPLYGGPGRITDVFVNQDGTFAAPPLPPGEYRLLAFRGPQPELEYENAEVMRVYDGKGQVVRLNSGQKEHVQVQLIPPGE